jgi:dolichol-phosphate mannosyltransferase
MWSMRVISKSESHRYSESLERQTAFRFALKLPPGLWRFAKFCLVGGSGVLVDMTVLYLLTDPSRLGWNITLGKICAAEIAMINNFIWNEIWTFQHSNSLPFSIRRSPSELARRFVIFNAICGIGIGFAVVMLHLFHGSFGLNLYISNLLAIVSVTFWNYGMNACFNWGRCRHAGRNGS